MATISKQMVSVKQIQYDQISRQPFAFNMADILEFACDQCDKSYYTKANLTRHIRSEHDKDRPSCNICHKTFSNYGGLRVHERTVHKVTFEDKSTQMSMSSVRGDSAHCLECPGTSFRFDDYDAYARHSDSHINASDSRQIIARPYQVWGRYQVYILMLLFYYFYSRPYTRVIIQRTSE